MATMTEEIMGLVDALIRRYDKGSFIEYRDARAAVLARIEVLEAIEAAAKEALAFFDDGTVVTITDEDFQRFWNDRERVVGLLCAALAPPPDGGE